ncbi:hypothetical protein CUU95_09740 [Vreelandella alkaliphila]|nr:hypothetical protein CUU95_09725 [Halomonas alkaliphila]AYF35779.1 hypothetical protein CUU95_09740 [Halomonas alkaliphila]
MVADPAGIKPESGARARSTTEPLPNARLSLIGALAPKPMATAPSPLAVALTPLAIAFSPVAPSLL